MKKGLLVLISIICISAAACAQSNTCYCYIATADSIYPVVPMTQGTDIGYPPTYRCNNCSSQPIALPFNFCFYGKEYDTVYINNKGCISFNKPVFNFSSKAFPLGSDTAMLAPFYANIDDTPQNPVSTSYAVISYKVASTHLIVQWSNAGYNTFDDDLYNNFQLTITNGADSILPAGNNVSFCYYLMQWASGDSSGGTMGFAGTPATIGITNGDNLHYAQFGAFDFPGHTYSGPYDTSSEVYWLNDKSFIFNTCVSGNNIPPVIINPDMCDTFTMCAGDTNSFTASFLCAQHGQTATVTESAPGILGVTTSTANTHSIYSITTLLIPHLRDTGSHIIKIKASDNGTPPLTDSMQFMVYIKPCGDTNSPTLGVNAINGNTNFSLYPNPNNGKFNIICHPDSYRDEQSEKSLPIIEIYNVLGQKVLSKTIHSAQGENTVNMSKSPSGAYFYRLSDEWGDLLGMGKFVIQ